MPTSLVSILIQLLMESPQLFADAETIITGVAHGEGGIAKVTTLAGNVATLSGHLATALGSTAAAPSTNQPSLNETAATAG